MTSIHCFVVRVTPFAIRAGCWLTAALLLAAWPLGAQESSSTNAAPAQPKDTAPPATAPAKQPAQTATNAAPAEAGGGEEISAESAREYPNWIEFSTGGNIVSGSTAEFQQRYRMQKGPFGGVEDFHWEQKVSKNNYLQIDGRAIFDNHDYNVKVELTNPKIGYLRGGYKEYRTWYNDFGGFFPSTGLYVPPGSPALALDRGEAWIEGGLTLPDYPKLSFKYTHQFREGEKDSTIWGDVGRPGAAGSYISIVPAFWNINEQRDIFEGDAQHTIGKTDLGLGVRYEMVTDNDALNTQRRSAPAGNQYLTDRQDIKSDIFNAHAFTITRLNDKVRFTTGYSFTTSDSDLAGQRVFANAYDVGYRPLLAFFPGSEGFYALTGGSHANEYVMNLNLMVTPWDHLSITPSVRVQKEDTDSTSSLIQTSAIGAPSPFFATTDRSFVEVAERLEARYTGVTNWVFYARGDWTEGQGDLFQNSTASVITFGSPLLRQTDDSYLVQQYTVGANWYPLQRLNTDLQYYHKMRNNDYTHQFDSTPNNSFLRYPGYYVNDDFDTDDLNVRLTLRPLNNLTLVTRYDFQVSSLYAKPDPISTMPKQHTADVTSHIIGESITYMPWSRLYLQAGLNYVRDDTTTAGSSLTPSVLPAKNNYWDTTFTVGYIINNKTDIQAHYFYYRANDYVNNSAFGVPYGAGSEENGVTVTLIRRLTDHLRLTLRYGFFSNHDQASGGLNDYTAHMVYSSLQYRF